MDSSLKTCPACNREIPVEEKICPYCMRGFDVYTEGFCPRCGEIVRAEHGNKCSHCGSDLENPHISSKPSERIVNAPGQAQPPYMPPLPVPYPSYTPLGQQPPWQQGPPGYSPYQAPMPMRKSENARNSMIFGIIGIVFCPVIFSIMAIVYSNKAKDEIRARGGNMSGMSEAQAGLVLGIIGLVLFVLLLIIRIALIGNSYNFNFDIIVPSLSLLRPLLMCV